MRQKRRLEFPFLHPFLFPLYMVLSLWLANFDQVQLFTLARPLVFALVTTVVTVIVSLLIFRNAQKACLFASLFLILFLSYGRIFSLVDMKSVLGFLIGRHRFMVPVWLALFAAGTFFIARARSNLGSLNQILNVVSLFLVVMVLAQAGLLSVQGRRAQAAVTEQETQPKAAVSGSASSPVASTAQNRDVYYILLDGYARQDVLATRHGVDTKSFIQQLTDLGFTVMPCAQSNYVWTPLSLGSSLNMNYIDTLGVSLPAQAERVNFSDFTGLLAHSRVRQKFESMGYRTATFKTAYSWLDITDSTYYFDAEKTSSFFNRQESINMQYLFLRTTAARLLIEAQEYSPKSFEKLPPFLLQMVNPKASLLSSRVFKQYEQNLYALDRLDNAPALPGPKFVYAHLFVTHQPYVFNLDGSLRWPPIDNMDAYNIQVQYANSRMIAILKNIIRSSKVPPVIVLQGDHGYLYDDDRVKILNAYYLPDGGASKLYSTITPVNTFRLIFNQYFGGKYPMLEDKSYHSYGDHPYQFNIVPNQCPVSTSGK